VKHVHHRIHKSRGGTDEEWNLLKTNPYDHAYDHALDFVLFEKASQFDFRHVAWPLLPEDLRQAVLKETSLRVSSRPVSKETRQKQSLAKKGKPPSNKGKKMPPEFSEKLSKLRKGKPAHNKGKKLSPEQREAISKARTGVKMSEETKSKISISLQGRTAHNAGKKASEETNRKRSPVNYPVVIENSERIKEWWSLNRHRKAANGRTVGATLCNLELDLKLTSLQPLKTFLNFLK
jgi:hypothetical protein